MSKRYVISGAPARYAVDYERELNPEQLAVVREGSGPLLVIAEAGSGKTRVVTYRVAWLIESGIPADRILLVTFTNKAAREMVARVEALVGSAVRRAWAGTFHHVANLILRQHAEVLGFGKNFTILDSEDARGLMDAAIVRSGVDTRERRFPKGDVLRDLMSMAVNTEASIAQALSVHYPQFEPLLSEIIRVSRVYQDLKRERNSVDYNDLLAHWLTLITQYAEIGDYWASTSHYVLVDEYQDTNKLQSDIIDRLASRHRNVMVVGDDAQSIYGWRGANFENLFAFKDRYPDAREYRLELNYRSTPEILAVANASIARNQRQFPKALSAVKRSRDTIPALIPSRDGDEQARFVAPCGACLDVSREARFSGALY